MRFLVAIKDTSKESKNILQIAVKIASGFGADISVIFVGKKSRDIIASEVDLARKSLAEWNIYHPGLEVLEWAYQSLKELNFLPENEIEFKPENLVEDKNRVRMVLPYTSGQKIRLILREGQLLEELKKELDFREYELIMVGNPKSNRNIHQIVQFLDSSIFIIKNFDPSWNYKILLCVDDSNSTKRAVMFGAQISKHFHAEVNVITVSKTKRFGKGYRNASRWAGKYLNLQKVPHNVNMITGKPTDTFVKQAGSDHIIVMGKAKGNEFFKYFKGSKPIHTAQKAECPILIVQ
ncbi:MAG: universal stress protein [Candidatus Marinimicrobia bacterium]|nr:universal stress protein [Candidatus Neomarinimicrobiota bacterium]MBL7022831.1 universal stress protein [Candidatus Neomarinimicrobiota bacterium]MBL7109448.1 universal stress protein [Candidatus Neomarinimicrobiota bacterium]